MDLFIRSCSYKIKRVKYRRDRLPFDWPRVLGPSVLASNESTDSAAKTDDKVDLLLYYFNMKTFKLKNAMLVTHTCITDSLTKSHVSYISMKKKIDK